jgi:hypothetical protein
MNPIGKFLILAGLVIVGAGLVFLISDKIQWLGKLPGDFTVKKDNFTFYFPLATCLIISVVLSLIMWFFRK